MQLVAIGSAGAIKAAFDRFRRRTKDLDLEVEDEDEEFTKRNWTIASLMTEASRTTNRISAQYQAYTRTPTAEQNTDFTQAKLPSPGLAEQPSPVTRCSFLLLCLVNGCLQCLHSTRSASKSPILPALVVSIIGSRADHCIPNDHGRFCTAREGPWPWW